MVTCEEIHQQSKIRKTCLLFERISKPLGIRRLRLASTTMIMMCGKSGWRNRHLHDQLKCGRDKSAIRLLVEAGANVNTPSKPGKDPPIVGSLKDGCIDIAMMLLEAHNVDVDQTGSDEKAPLYIACDKRFLQVAERLIHKGANVNKSGWNGNTPLYMACGSRNDNRVVKLLLENGANVNQPNSAGDTPLHKACEEDVKTTVDLLLRMGANVHQANANGESPLYKIMKYYDHRERKMLDLLLESGADVNQGDVNGNTPFHLVVTRHSVSVAELFLQHGAHVNQRNKAGWTALRMALRSDMVNFLKIHGGMK
jgi:ankyrin repeat protein